MQGMNDLGKILFSRFVYSAWEGHKCTVPISEEERKRVLNELYLCGTGKGEFPERIMNYPTKFYGYVKDLSEKNVREYIYHIHPKIVVKHLEDVPEKLIEGIKRNCFVWVCEAKDSERVVHPLGYELKAKRDFCDFNKGDHVSIHWSYALEKVNKNFGREVNEKIISIFPF